MGRDSHSFVKLYNTCVCSKPFRFLFLSFADEMSRSVGESVPFFSGWRNSGGQQRIGEEEEEERNRNATHASNRRRVRVWKNLQQSVWGVLRDCKDIFGGKESGQFQSKTSYRAVGRICLCDSFARIYTPSLASD